VSRTTAAVAAVVSLALAPVAWAVLPVAEAAPAAEPLVVDAGAARVVVEQAPFRLSVTDGDGRTVLQEVAHAAEDSLVEPGTTDPVGTGADNQDTPTLYSPLSFLVGEETLEQHENSEWVANLRGGGRHGTWYAARSVESVAREGADLVLTLSTTDPSGRTLVVRIGTARPGAVRVRVNAVPADGVAMIGDSFTTTATEGFFGFGGRHDRLDQRGRVISSFVNQQNFNARPGQQVDMYPNGPAAAYYAQAMFWTPRYGFLLPQPELARFKLAADREDAWNVTASAAHLDYVVAPGAPRRSASTLTALTGRHRTPPTWALGPMMDRLVKNFGETLPHYESMLKADLRNIDKHDLPLTAYRLEGSTFVDNPEHNHGLSLHTWVTPKVQQWMIRQLRKRGIRTLSYLRPWLTPDSAPVQAGYAVRHADGSPYYVVGTADRRFALIDFTNPDAVAFWQRQVRDTLDMGFEGFMQDYGEQVMLDMHFADGTTGVTRHNDYLTLMAKATREELTRYRTAHPERRPWFFTRAGYSGLPGSAAYENANFPGDETTDWDRTSGLGSLTTDMLNRAVGGAYGYATDIGGYFDYISGATDKELFIRWAQWAALSPVFRLHGSGRLGTHAPWSYDAETLRIYKRYSRLHLRARPLLKKLWKQADRTGVPVTRPLWWQHPGDRQGWHQDQEWLLGDDLLVAPVVVEGATARKVYLPQGCWQLHGRGDRWRGKRSVQVEAGLASLPWFTRCGTAPLG
jgi:alpha-glucosidase (family GH31 glycosyl hydrolase)